MRINQPVTQTERHLDPARPVVTKTDLKGVITYANPAFLEISGYTFDELVGQPHNLVRHPDMPPEAFDDLWQVIRSGRPWRGIVKNRAKNGDFYWVEAYVTPLYKDGQHIGYMSVRSRPSIDQITQAQELYRAVTARQVAFPATRQKQQITMKVRLAAMVAVPLLFFVVSLLAESGWVRGLLAVCSGVASAVLAGWVWRGMDKPLSEAQNAFLKLSEGNFKFDVSAEAATEFSSLLTNLTSMRISLRAIIADVVSAANEVGCQAGMLSRQVSDVVGRSAQAADGIASVAAALEQLSVSVSEISDATSRSSGLAQSANELVEKCAGIMDGTLDVSGDVVESVQGAQELITSLGASITSINQITNTIKEIADQTNLLALNAAIEAARAGEQGRGFAVVADEVRKLAERTANSTQEIGQMIFGVGQQTTDTLTAMQAAASKVDESTRLTRESSEAVGSIKTISAGITESTRDVASTLDQQNAAAAEVAATMERMSALSEQNNSSISQLGQSAIKLEQTAEALHRLVKHFESSL